jgi:predicted DsbA family dithiol-disulfide isomerase
LIHVAKHAGLQSEINERLKRVYFTESLSFSDSDTLVQLAVEVGVDIEHTRQILETDSYAAEVRADMRRL